MANAITAKHNHPAQIAMILAEEPMSISSILYTGISILAGVVVLFWRMLVDSNKRTEEKLSKCESKHEGVSTQFSDLRAELGFLKGRQDGIESLANQVLTTVAELHRKNTHTAKASIPQSSA